MSPMLVNNQSAVSGLNVTITFEIRNINFDDINFPMKNEIRAVNFVFVNEKHSGALTFVNKHFVSFLVLITQENSKERQKPFQKEHQKPK